MDLSKSKTENKVEVFVVSAEMKKERPSIKSSCFRINREMLRFKVHYFFFAAAMGVTLPFIPILATTRVGLSGTALGALLTSQQFIFIITKPLSGYLADYFNKLKLIINVEMVIVGVTNFLLLFVPPIDKGVAVGLEQFVSSCKYQELSVWNMECSSFQPSYDNFIENMENSSLEIELDKIPCFDEMLIYFELNQEETEIGPNACYLRSKNLMTSLNYLRNTTDYLQKISHSNRSGWEFCCRSPEKQYHIHCSCNKTTYDSATSDFYTYQFWTFAAIQTIQMVSMNSMFTLSDTALCENAEKYGSDFGRQRLWAAISWGAMSAVGGLLYDYTNDYMAAAGVMAIMCAVSLWNITKMDLVKPQFSQNILKDVGKVIRSKEFIFFEIGVWMCGLGTSIMWFYHIIFLSHLGASRFLCGMSQVVQCFVGEVPFMFYSKWVIDKLGHFNVLSMSLLAYAIRFLWYSYSYNPWLVLPIEVVHGFTYGLFYPAVAAFAKKSSKLGSEATTQSIMFMTYEGPGAGIGCIVFGMGYEYFGWHHMFFYCSIFAFCGVAVVIVFTVIIRRDKQKDDVSKGI